MFFLISRVNRSLSTLCAITALTGGCVQTERVPFDIQLTQQACTDQHADLSHVLLMLMAIEADETLCLLQSAEMTPGERASSVLEAGVLEYDEVLLAALAYTGDCVRCQALARVSLEFELTRYTLDLQPTEQCEVPLAAMEGLGLSLTELPPAACSP